MNKQTAIKILRYNPYITVNDTWKAFVAARARALNVEWQSEWLNNNANYSFIDPPDIKKESTYEECIDFDCKINDDDVITLTITLWDGSLFDGSRISKRCKFNCVLDEIPGFLNEALNQQLKKIGESLYNKQEQIKKEREIERLIDSWVIE